MSESKDTSDPPSMGDEIAQKRYVFRADCPVCYESHGKYESDEKAIKEARRCYYSHDETPTPSADEAEAIGLDADLRCPENVGGCGWTGKEYKQSHSTIEFHECPQCGNYGVVRDP